MGPISSRNLMVKLVQIKPTDACRWLLWRVIDLRRKTDINVMSGIVGIFRQAIKQRLYLSHLKLSAGQKRR